MTRFIMAGASALLLAGCATTASAPVRVAASPADLAGIDAAIDGVYAVISGPAGQPRDWDAMRAMFTPGAKLQATTPKGLWGGSVQNYIDKSGPVLIKDGFHETELARRVEVYGNIAHVWSSYHGMTDDKTIDIRGINSFQLVRQADGRWLVDSILWQPESKTIPLPADMEK